MKNFNQVALLTLGLSSPCYGETLDEIYQLALENDYKLQSAHSAYQADTEDARIARAGLLPKMDLEGSWTVAEDSSTITRHNPFAIPLDQTDNAESIGYSITLSQPLIDFSAYHNFKRGTVRAKIAEIKYQREKQALIYRVAESYLTTIKHGAEFDAAKSVQQAYARQLESINNSFATGLVRGSAVSQVRAALDASKAESIIARNQLNVSFDALKVLTGVAHKNVFTLKSGFIAKSPEPVGAAEWIHSASENNFDLILVRLQADEAEQYYNSARAQHLPTLTATIQYNNRVEERNYTYTVDDELELDGYRAGLTLHVPLSSGGAVSASRRQAHYQFQQQRELSLDLGREVEQTAHSLFLSMIAGVANVNARRVSVESRKSALTSIQNGYNEGVENISDVLDAQRFYFEEQVHFFNAIYSYLIAGMKLRQITSQLSEKDIVRLNALVDVAAPVLNPDSEY